MKKDDEAYMHAHTYTNKNTHIQTNKQTHTC